jgi:hypothetical protein
LLQQSKQIKTKILSKHQWSRFSCKVFLWIVILPSDFKPQHTQKVIASAIQTETERHSFTSRRILSIPKLLAL